MIITGEFDAWLSSGRRQAASQAAAEAVGKGWSEKRIWADLRADIAASAGDSEALESAARRALSREGEIAQILREGMAAARLDPFFRPPVRQLGGELHSGLLLFDSPEIMISLGVIRLEPLAAKKAGPRAGTSIMFNGETTLFRLVKAGSATFSFWESPGAGDDFTSRTAGRCRCTGRRRVSDGETFLVDGRSQSFVIENALSDLIVFQAVIRAAAAPLSVEYDSRTRRFVGASSTDESGSRLEMMATLLRLLDARDAIPLLTAGLASFGFHTRWHLMRELLAWDAEAALPALRVMAGSDPHPDVREAAQSTLAKFFPEEALATCLA